MNTIIRPHKNKYYVVENPTDEMIKLAKTLPVHTKIIADKNQIVVNQFAREKFEKMLAKEEENTTVVPTFVSFDDIAEDFFAKFPEIEYILNYYCSYRRDALALRWFNEKVAGLTIVQAKKRFRDELRNRHNV